MTLFLVILDVFLGINFLVWLMRHITITDSIHGQETLGSNSPLCQDQQAPRISVLVAARDEQDNIQRCIQSLLSQDYPNCQLIAINDRSSDQTGQILHSLAQKNDQRIKVIDVEDLPPGWFGKNNAMRLGMQQAHGDWLLFTDADCNFICPQTLSVAMRYALDNQIDFLSILPVLHTSSTWERIIQPVCGAILMFWFRPQWVNDPARSTAYANGAFMLMTRRCYDQIGGHEATRTQVNEDMHMARHAKQGGLKLRVVQNSDLYRTRMYDSFAASYHGWSRIFYGCFASFRRLAVALTLLAVMSMLPYVVLATSLLIAILNGWQLSRIGWLTLSLAAFATIAQQSALTRLYHLTGSRWYRALTYPIGAALALGMLASAIVKQLGGRVTWRGRQYRQDKVLQQ